MRTSGGQQVTAVGLLDGRGSHCRWSRRRHLNSWWWRILSLLWFRVPEERTENDAQADQHQNARPPIPPKKQDCENDQPETTPWTEEPWAVSKSFMSVHIVILL
jgi:hypothetical protein